MRTTPKGVVCVSALRSATLDPVPLDALHPSRFAIAILVTRALPRWIGWLGLLVGLLAGWLGLAGPASGVLEGVASLGFIGFFVFLLSMGIAMLRRTASDAVSQTTT